MTKTEVEQLIAEIKNRKYDGYADPEQTEEIIIEIINRFANKPPEERYTLSNKCSQEINIHNVQEDAVMVLRAGGRYKGEFVMNQDLLKQHIEHCSKMLEHLENE